jgi:nucleoside-diphosphate-sugar epimerase
MPHLIVTGGNGYVGEAVLREALARGWRVTSLERRPAAATGPLTRLPWRLGDPLPEALARGPAADALVHVAHHWESAGGDDDPNLVGTEALLGSCRAAGIQRFVFVSSVSARPDALNLYGRLKYRLEQRVAAQGGVSARVGLVYGGQRRAQYGVLLRLAGLGLLPMIDPHRAVQPIHLDEVAAGLLTLAAAPSLARPVYVLAAPQAMRFAAFLERLSRIVRQRPLLVLPVPGAVALLAADLCRFLPFLPRVNRERILGLKGMQFVPSAEDLAALGLVVDDMTPSLLGEPGRRRRQLLGEGAALIAYVLGARPEPRLVRLYARALHARGEAAPLPLAFARRWPFLLRFMEPLGGGSVLAARLALATRLAETGAAGADRFFAYRGTRLGRLASAGGALALDLLVLPFRLMRR